jgi:hypothetical protein
MADIYSLFAHRYPQQSLFVQPPSFADRLYAYGSPMDEVEDRRGQSKTEKLKLLPRVVLGDWQPWIDSLMTQRESMSNLPAQRSGALSDLAGFSDIDKLKAANWPNARGL